MIKNMCKKRMVSLLALRAQWLAKTYAPNKKKDNKFLLTLSFLETYNFYRR